MPSRDFSRATSENPLGLEKTSPSTDLLFVSGSVFQIFEIVGVIDL
jgi:hypothetical protein